MEVEHKHSIRGAGRHMIRLLGFRNNGGMGRFSDAIATFEQTLKRTRRPARHSTTDLITPKPRIFAGPKPNVKKGIGGVRKETVHWPRHWRVPRAMYADGQTEVYAYTSTDRSAIVGVMANGSSAGSRPGDVTGIGGYFGWISNSHAKIPGNGRRGWLLVTAPSRPRRKNLDMFYSAHFGKIYWLTGDYSCRESRLRKCRPRCNQRLYRENPWRVLNQGRCCVTLLIGLLNLLASACRCAATGGRFRGRASLCYCSGPDGSSWTISIPAADLGAQSH